MQNVTELERWIVKDNDGNVVARFSTQSKAIDFANREQKIHKHIVLVDITRCELQLIAAGQLKENVG